MKRRYWFAIAVTVLGLLVLWPVVSYHRAKARLESYKKELRVKGEKLSPTELAPTLVRARCDNGRSFISAADRLPSIPYGYQPSVMQGVVPGRARVAWKQEKLTTQKETNIWPRLREELGKTRDILAEIRETLEGPEFQFVLDHSRGKLSIAHLAHWRKATETLGAAVLVDLHDGNFTEACANLRALGLLVGHCDEPIWISNVVRYDMMDIGLSTTWEVLQFRGWREEQLAELQAAWDAFEFSSTVELDMAMSRANGQEMFADFRRSRTEFLTWNSPRTIPGTSANGFLGQLAEIGTALAKNPERLLSALRDRSTRYWTWRWWHSHDEELAFLRQRSAGIEAARQANAARSFQPAYSQLEKTLALLANSWGQAARDFVSVEADGGGVKMGLGKAARAETHRRLVVSGKQTASFRSRES